VRRSGFQPWAKGTHWNWVKSLAEIGWLKAYGETIVR
jgi:hypothetical protein